MKKSPSAPTDVHRKVLLPHSRTPQEILGQLSVSIEKGLDSAQGEERLRQAGPNILGSSSRPGILLILWRQINDPLMYVLLGSGVLAVALGKGTDSLVVFAVVILNTLIGFVQEYRAEEAIGALIEMVPDDASVLRDGRWATISSEEIVPGDIIYLQSGDKVPADARIVEAKNLQVDESALTGESVPVHKHPGTLAQDMPLADRANMAYGGTLVTYGTATAVVTATGAQSELGRISSMLGEATETDTPLTKQIATVGKWITVAIVIVSLLLFLVGLLRGYPTVDAAFAGITLAVASIPEGLPAVITIALAIGVQRMARRRAVIRRLPAVETLGSTTVICTDKTGTLTRGEMTVREIWVPTAGGETSYEVSGVGYVPEGELTRREEDRGPPTTEFRELLLSGALCNDAGLVRDGEAWRVEGDPTEGALIVAARKADLDEKRAAEELPRRDAVPFESERQYMATLHEKPDGGQVIYLKGAPEVVLERCSDSAAGCLDEDETLGHVDRMAEEGLRILALARKEPLSPRTEELAEEDVAGGFTLLGLVGIMDPPREEAVRAVARCRRAGITVKMITGDHAETARSIGHRLGLTEGAEEVLTGSELDTLSEAQIGEVASRANVFARVAPEHKLRLVRSLQERGEVVAMTGDGVNDAPALKQADIGVAMGITGTDVSQESADIVLTDDNFATIAAAVEEGRRVYDNLIKALAFILPTSAGQALLILLGVTFFPVVGGDPLLPVRPTQVLWVNLVVAVALALPLAFEVLEPDALERPPRKPGAPVLDLSLVVRTAVVGLLIAVGGIGLFLIEYYGQQGRGAPGELALAEAQTMAVTTVIFFQIFYLIECRSLRGSLLRLGLFSNKWIYAGIGVLIVLQIGFVHLPFMNAIFGSAPLGLTAWIRAFAVALLVIPVVGAEKWWRGRRLRQKHS